MFGGIKSLVNNKQTTAQPVAQEPINPEGPVPSGFGFTTNFSKIASDVAAAKANKAAADKMADATGSLTAGTATGGISTLDTGTAGATTGATTTTTPTFDYGNLNPGQRRVVDTLLDRVAAGTYTAGDESRLISLGKKSGVDLITQARNRLTAAPVDTLSTFVSPTTYEQNINQIFGLRQNEERDFDTLAARVRAGETLKPGEQNRLNEYLTRGGLGTYESYFAKDFAPTSTDLFANLNYGQEQDLANLAARYSAGETLSNKQLNTLTSLLSTAGLGDIQSYFAPATYTAPTGYESMFGAGEISPTSDISAIVGQFNTFVEQSDPVAAAQYARSLGLDESEILALLEGYGTSKTYKRPNYTQQQLEEIFKQGDTGLQERIDTIFTTNLGTDEDVEQLTTYFNDKYNLDLTVQDVKDMYNVDTMKDKSIAEIEAFIQNSAFNRLQEANKFGGIVKNVFGEEDVASVLRDVMSSGESAFDPEFRAIYNDLLRTNQMTGDMQDRILTAAARLAPDSSFWQNQYDDNGKLVGMDKQALFAAYKDGDIEAITTLSGKRPGSLQYGTYNGAPILNAEIMRQGLGDSDFANVTQFYGKNRELAEQLGWDFSSQENYTSIKHGLAAFGIDTNILNPDEVARYDRVMADAKKFGNRSYTDEAGRTYYVTGMDGEGNPIYESPTLRFEYVGEGNQAYDIDSQVTALNNQAKKLGLDPTQFDSLSDMYAVMSAMTDDYFMVVGQFTGDSRWGELGKNNPDAKGKNHAAVMYQEINGRLIPISEPTFFRYKDPDDNWVSNTFGSTIGDIVQGFSEIPFFPEVVAFVTKSPELYAALKGLQTGTNPEASFGDVLKSAGMAYLKSTLIPKVIAPELMEGIGGLEFLKDMPADWQNFVAETGTNAIISAGIAGLSNENVGDAILNSVAKSSLKFGTDMAIEGLEDTELGQMFESTKGEFMQALEKLTGDDEQFSFKNIDPRFRDVVSNIIVDTMFGKDFDEAVQNGIQRLIMTGIMSKTKDKPKDTTLIEA